MKSKNNIVVQNKYEKIDFIGIGSAKSASTWVSECLGQHPDILFSAQKTKKELRFFNSSQNHVYAKDNVSNFHKGIEWYLKQFPEYKEGKIRGEFSISYLTDENAAINIYNYFPNAKILVILRNPTDMLYSLYWFVKSTIAINIPKSFEDFVKKTQYPERGLYYMHLKRYYDLFPKENIFVMFHDDVKEKPEKALKSLYEFLGVDNNFKPQLINKKVAVSKRTRYIFLQRLGYALFRVLTILGFKSLADYKIVQRFLYPLYIKFNMVSNKYPPMSRSIRLWLVNYYTNDIIGLEKLLNRDLSSWRK